MLLITPAFSPATNICFQFIVCLIPLPWYSTQHNPQSEAAATTFTKSSITQRQIIFTVSDSASLLVLMGSITTYLVSGKFYEQCLSRAFYRLIASVSLSYSLGMAAFISKDRCTSIVGIEATLPPSETNIVLKIILHDSVQCAIAGDGKINTLFLGYFVSASFMFRWGILDKVHNIMDSWRKE